MGGAWLLFARPKPSRLRQAGRGRVRRPLSRCGNGVAQASGLGSYTAAAIAAIAFGRRAVRSTAMSTRVVARLSRSPPLPRRKPLIRELAERHRAERRAGDFAQAMMDLGATICTPKTAGLRLMPLATANAPVGQAGTRRIFRSRRPSGRGRTGAAAFFVRRADGAVLVRTRPPKGLLGGMVEFPGTAWSVDFDPGAALREAPIRAPYRKLAAAVEHAFTHFSLRLDIYVAAAAPSCPAPMGCRWAKAEEFDKEALPSVMRKVAAAARESGCPSGGKDRAL